MFRQGGRLQLSASCTERGEEESWKRDRKRVRHVLRRSGGGGGGRRTFNFIFVLPLTGLKSLWQSIAEAMSLSRLSLHAIDRFRLAGVCLAPTKSIFVNGLSLDWRNTEGEYPVGNACRVWRRAHLLKRIRHGIVCVRCIKQINLGSR